MNSSKRKKKLARKKRIRAKIKGSKERPRLTVFRSNKHFYAQIIDDQKGKTLISAAEKDLGSKPSQPTEKTNIASELGKILAQKALKKGIKEVTFDRGAYKYHGRVKALAESARSEGLKF